MANLQDSATTSAEQAAWFTTTHWSIVLNAQDPASPQAGEALERLCRSYQLGTNKEHWLAARLGQAFFSRGLRRTQGFDWGILLCVLRVLCVRLSFSRSAMFWPF
jgi:hypothetical protein